MGRRSRKRMAEGVEGPSSEAGTSRAQRDAARERRAEAARSESGSAKGSPPARRPRTGERPPPPWGSFPLSELVVLLGIVLAVAGFIVGVEEARGRTMFFAGIVLGALGGLETSVRDHFGGYRSHTTLLAGLLGFIAIVAMTFALGALAPSLDGSTAFIVAFVTGALVFAIAFPLFRRAFQRRSGGLSFR